VRFYPGTGQVPTAIVVRTARLAGDGNRWIGENQVAWVRGELASGVSERGALSSRVARYTAAGTSRDQQRLSEDAPRRAPCDILLPPVSLSAFSLLRR
jgi:hypothetical protein